MPNYRKKLSGPEKESKAKLAINSTYNMLRMRGTQVRKAMRTGKLGKLVELELNWGIG